MNIYELWQKKEVQLAIDICRILLVILLVAILFVLIKEIKAVKLLAYDPCKLCMNKTDAICICFYANSNIDIDAERKEIRAIEKRMLPEGEKT